MARRISFEVAEDKSPSASEPSRAPALSGMAKSLQAASAATVRDIPIDLIDASNLRDRLEVSEEEIEELSLSIKEQGQLIPILVSPLPQGRYRIVYGRRRLEALRRLGLPAKALVRDLDDTQAILAQGQENSVRKDLSWIEKASFARELLEDGRSDELICDALNIDQKARRSGEKLTGLSRMRQVTARLSSELISAIGPAPSVGRDRWYDLSLKIERKGLGPVQQNRLIEELVQAADAGALNSDDRFGWIEAKVAQKTEAVSEKVAATAFEGTLGQVKATARSVTITVTTRSSQALHAWISANPGEALAALEEARLTQQQQEGSTG